MNTCCFDVLFQNWENQIASQMYMLIWIDFFLQVVVALVVTTIWKWVLTGSLNSGGLDDFHSYHSRVHILIWRNKRKCSKFSSLRDIVVHQEGAIYFFRSTIMSKGMIFS